MEGYNKYLTNKNPILGDILEKLLEILDNVTDGQYIIEKKKTSLHVVAKSAFLGIHFMKDKLRLNIVLDHELTNELVRKVDKISANRFHNELDIDNPNQLDKEIESFIKNAYILKK